MEKSISYKLHTACRVCGSTHLTQYLDLGLMPLSNNLCASANEQPDRYPLKVLFCENCGLSQLSIVIDPETLFGHYVYRSSISQGYRDHCHVMALDLAMKYNLNADSFHIDIAGNDGALLAEFKKVVPGIKQLNVDPAVNLVPINDAQNIKMFNTFWGMDAAKHLQNVHFPKADLITATNVFAHVDDVKEFLEACKLVLKDTGVLVLEFPYLVDFIEKGEFDTVYFEHLSYFSIGPLYVLCQQLGMGITDVSKQDIHGGSVRVTITKGNSSAYLIKSWLTSEHELAYDTINPYYQFAKKVRGTISLFRTNIEGLKAEGYNIVAFGASAKGNTLLNCAGITSREISYIIDQTPEKIGKYSPGTGIPIYDITILPFSEPDFIVLLAWNFADECIGKLVKAGYKGKFILPLTFEIINQYETKSLPAV
jgi:ubiquinone/menaquinone biosynthesis C-methylase UbiE